MVAGGAVVAAARGVVVAVGLCTMSTITPGRQAIRSGMYLEIATQKRLEIKAVGPPSGLPNREEERNLLAVARITHERHSHRASLETSNVGIEGVQHVLQEHKAFFASDIRIDQLKVLDDGAHPEALHAWRGRAVLGHEDERG